jgi:hypothetical protein
MSPLHTHLDDTKSTIGNATDALHIGEAKEGSHELEIFYVLTSGDELNL